MTANRNPTPALALLSFFGLWTAFWCVERMYLYSFATPEAMVNATVPFYMPYPDAPEEWKGALAGALSMMYAPDREFFSRVVHVQLSGVLALCCLVNLAVGNEVAALPASARPAAAVAVVHRFAGRTFQICAVPWSLYLNYVLFVHGMIPFGPVVDTLDKVASVVSTLAFGAGLRYVLAREKNIPAHRCCMVVGSAALFVIPIQRLYWYLTTNYIVRSLEYYGGNLMNYFVTVDMTFVAATATVVAMGYFYAKDDFSAVTVGKKKAATSDAASVKAKSG